MRLLKIALIAAPLSLPLAACGSRDGDGAGDYAAQFGEGQSGQDNAAIARLPKAAPDGRKAIRYTKPYQGRGLDGNKSAVQFFSNGTYRLQEGGRTRDGQYQWLPDGKRLRLVGVTFRPIVLIADDGAMYRMTNENVPITDLTPDRLFSSK
jgi:hypothetical protein